MHSDALAESIVRWAIRHSECESSLLYPRPSWFVFLTPLIEHVRDAQHLSEEQIAEWVCSEEKLMAKERSK